LNFKIVFPGGKIVKIFNSLAKEVTRSIFTLSIQKPKTCPSAVFIITATDERHN
jgi:hypothetical protein